MAQATASAIQESATGTSGAESLRNIWDQMLLITWARSISVPYFVRTMELMAVPNPAPAEVNSQDERPGGDPPLDPCRKSQGDQREHHIPHQQPAEDRTGDPQVGVHPLSAGQAGLNHEKNQPGNPGDQREETQQHAHLSEDIFGAREGAAEVERQGVVSEVGRDQAGSDERGEKVSHGALETAKELEQAGVDRQCLADGDIESLQESKIMRKVNKYGTA